MSVIRTAFPQSEVQSLDALRIDKLRLNPSDADVTNLQITRGGPVVAGINVLTADLLAALDATANTDVAAKVTALAMARGARDEWKARAEAAEAAVVRVMEWARDWMPEGGVAAFRELDAILDEMRPKPAFTLPAEVPARIVAVKRSTGSETELTLFTDGDTTWWADIEDWGPFWTRSQVMDTFTDHRLIGADQ